MSTMTLKDVVDRLRMGADYTGHEITDSECEEMADALDAHLRERESAKAVVTDDLDYVPGELDRTAPVRIWLQIDTVASSNDREEPWPGCDDVTWQDESIGGLEIQYVRADLVVPMLASARVSDGWQLVPIEPTQEMLEMAHALDPLGCDVEYAADVYPAIWKAMLATAPKPETEE